MIRFLGHIDHTSLYKNLQLVVRQHLFPHDDRKSRARLEALMRNLAGLQDGRSLDFLHLVDAHEHEQATHDTNQINENNTFAVFHNVIRCKYMFHKVLPFSKSVH